MVMPCLQRVIWGAAIKYHRLKPAAIEKIIVVFPGLTQATPEPNPVCHLQTPYFDIPEPGFPAMILQADMTFSGSAV